MSKGREVDAWSKHQEYIANYIKYFQKDPKKELNSSSYRHKYSAKELDILHKNHRFLWNDDDATDLSWEQRIAKKYYDRLLKEYALVELKYYKIGRIAMRWRTEDEVIRGKGQFTCGCLRCDESEGLSSWEVNFAYVEMGEKKNVLVKVRLCEACSAKLNYNKMHQRASRSDAPPSTKESAGRRNDSSGSSRSSRRSRHDRPPSDRHRERRRSRSRSRQREKSSKSDRSRGRRRSRSRSRDGSRRRNRSKSGSRSTSRGRGRRRDRSAEKSSEVAENIHHRHRRDNRSASPPRERTTRSVKDDSEPSEDFESFFAGLFE